VLGTAWKDKTITRQDGTSIIRIENLSCIVTGYFDSFGNDDDESVLVFYSPNSINQNDSIYEYLAENMIPAGTGIPAFSIELLDNKYSVDKVAADMIGNFNKSEAYMGEQSNSIKKDTDIYMFYKFKMIILVLIFLIGLINCIMISQLWFLRQRKDISIMKTMGVSNKMILKWQLLKMLIMMAVSFVIASLADILYLKISGGSFALSVNVYSVLYVIASIVIMLLAMIFPLCILLEKIIPAQEVGRL
jgi:ABC-type antimicrobial peptide transport system permease subunit